MKAAKKLLQDKAALTELVYLLTKEEFGAVFARLQSGEDDFFAIVANALATEAMFNSDRAQATPPLEVKELLTREELLMEIAWSLAVDQLGAKEVTGILERDPNTKRQVVSRAEECKELVAERLFSKSDPLFTTVVCRLAALMLVNAENVDADWDAPVVPPGPKKLPN